MAISDEIIPATDSATPARGAAGVDAAREEEDDEDEESFEEVERSEIPEAVLASTTPDSPEVKSEPMPVTSPTGMHTGISAAQLGAISARFDCFRRALDEPLNDLRTTLCVTLAGMALLAVS